MMRRLLFGGIVVLLAVAGAFAQDSTEEQGKKTDAVLAKISKLDMLNFMLPLGMKKEQYEKLLPVLEKIREHVRKVQAGEAEAILKLEAEVDASLKDAVDKGLVPPKELRDKIGKTMHTIALNREIDVERNVDIMYEALTGIWNKGQLKVAAQSLDPRQFDPKAKVEEMKDEDKIRIYVREIMLNPAIYQVLLDLYKKTI